MSCTPIQIGFFVTEGLKRFALKDVSGDSKRTWRRRPLIHLILFRFVWAVPKGLGTGSLKKFGPRVVQGEVKGKGTLSVGSILHVSRLLQKGIGRAGTAKVVLIMCRGMNRQ
jgi:hypothetical protein